MHHLRYKFGVGVVALRHLGSQPNCSADAWRHFFANRWMAHASGLTAAVEFTLVRTQMITGNSQKLWRMASDSRALTPQPMANAMFWTALLISVATDNCLAGFVAGASITMLYASLACHRILLGTAA